MLTVRGIFDGEKIMLKEKKNLPQEKTEVIVTFLEKENVQPRVEKENPYKRIIEILEEGLKGVEWKEIKEGRIKN